MPNLFPNFSNRSKVRKVFEITGFSKIKRPFPTLAASRDTSLKSIPRPPYQRGREIFAVEAIDAPANSFW